jgi:hypothetical protein
MTKLDTKHKILIGITALVVAGGIGYLLYQNYKKKKITDNANKTPTEGGDKPLSAEAFLSLFTNAMTKGKSVDETKKKAILDMYNSLNDKEKLAMTEIVNIQIECIKANSTDPMKAFGCIAQGSQGLVSKYGKDTLDSVGKKSEDLFKTK